jgi:phage tail-like protein
MPDKLTSLAGTIEPSPPQIPTGPATNGHAVPGFPGGAEPEPSSYLKYLPAIYSSDSFAGRFLRIFEEILGPIQVMVDNQPYYFDPMTAPVALLDWLEFWVNLDDEADDWPMPKRRALVAAIAALYRMRGTGAGIKRHVGIYAGGLPLLQDRTNGFRLDPDARLGLNTSIGEDRPHTFTVTVAVPDPRDLDMETLTSIIEADKPVETSYILRVVKLEKKGSGDRKAESKRR